MARRVNQNTFATHEWELMELCVRLAREALAAGDAPFGAVLATEQGEILRSDRNRVRSQDSTYHPELALARWAASELSPDVRQQTVLYTSGEHCPMCSAAHAWARLGRIVFLHSTAQLTAWQQAGGFADSRVTQLSIRTIAPDLQVIGPVPEFTAQLKQLHRQAMGLAEAPGSG